MTHFNQPLTTTTTIPAKFRPDDNTVETKYNGHIVTGQQQYTTIPYSQPSDDKRLIATAISYPQSTIATTTSTAPIQTQQQEISQQDLCNAILQQQTVDTKRGE